LTISWKRKDKNEPRLLLKLEIFFLKASGLISVQKTFYNLNGIVSILTPPILSKTWRNPGT
jgi:hypothetical protein